MNIYVKLKSAGKKKPVLDDAPYYLPDGIATLRQLIEAVVRQEVDKLNKRGNENMLVQFLTEEEISDKSAAGKVGFGRLYSERRADPEKAVQAALLGFEDGLFKVLVGEKEITEMDSPLEIGEDDVLTFIRLTFLAGRLW